MVDRRVPNPELPGLSPAFRLIVRRVLTERTAPGMVVTPEQRELLDEIRARLAYGDLAMVNALIRRLPPITGPVNSLVGHSSGSSTVTGELSGGMPALEGAFEGRVSEPKRSSDPVSPVALLTVALALDQVVRGVREDGAEAAVEWSGILLLLLAWVLVVKSREDS